jgi:hypothetical protein
MDVLGSLGDILRALLIAVGAFTLVFVLLVLILFRMRRDNALKRGIRLLTYRVAATLLAGLFAIPIEPIPIADAIYDLGVPIALIWYWLKLFRDIRRPPHTYAPSGPPQIEQDRRSSKAPLTAHRETGGR